MNPSQIRKTVVLGISVATEQTNEFIGPYMHEPYASDDEHLALPSTADRQQQHAYPQDDVGRLQNKEWFCII